MADRRGRPMTSSIGMVCGLPSDCMGHCQTCVIACPNYKCVRPCDLEQWTDLGWVVVWQIPEGCMITRPL